jgi:glycosyltransferase involved in cell wall biosynthesis
MNITLICNEYPPLPQGGIGTFTYHYAHGLTRLGHSVTVAGLSNRALSFQDGAVRVVFLAAPEDGADRRRVLRDWVAGDVDAHRTGIVEVPEFEGMMPFASAGCPVVVRLHQSLSGILLARRRPPRPVTYHYERETLRHHRHWIAVSNAVLGYTRRIFLLRPAKAEVIYNFAPPGLLPDRELVASLRREHGDYVIFVGKITEGKGALDLARAAARFLVNCPTLKLVYLGQDCPRRGNMMSALIAAAVGDDVRRRVVFPGARPHAEAMAWVAAARAFVLPSHLEAFSLAPLEAMRLGVPVIFTSRASGPELVDDGRTGLLVDPANPNQIAAAVWRVVSDPAFASDMARQAAAALESRFSLERCIRESLRFYSEVLGERTADLSRRESRPEHEERRCPAI